MVCLLSGAAAVHRRDRHTAHQRHARVVRRSLEYFSHPVESRRPNMECVRPHRGHDSLRDARDRRRHHPGCSQAARRHQHLRAALSAGGNLGSHHQDPRRDYSGYHSHRHSHHRGDGESHRRAHQSVVQGRRNHMEGLLVAARNAVQNPRAAFADRRSSRVLVQSTATRALFFFFFFSCL